MIRVGQFTRSLAQQPAQFMQSRDLATHEKLPNKFLEAILLALRRGGFLESKVGMGGGYRLTRAPKDIKVSDLIRRLEGRPAVTEALPIENPTPGQIAVQLVGEKLTFEAFTQLSGNLAGYPFVKVVVDRPRGTIHFLNHSQFQFHADYIAERLLGISQAQLEREIDSFNQSVYLSPDRRFFLGIIALHKKEEGRFFTLETVEIDNMDEEKVRFFFNTVKENLDPSVPLFWKPANHIQEAIVANIAPAELPRVFSHELLAQARFVALNAGVARGRLRAFRSEAEYRAALSTVEWHDILVMHRVPDDIPRVSGIINAHPTTPLSHTNVLASGWQIPNCIQLGIFELITQEKLDGQWVNYTVDMSGTQAQITRIDRPVEVNLRPAWSVQRIEIEEPETLNTPIRELGQLRMSDRYKYGTKAANLGELRYVLDHGSERMLGFYRVRRPPRANLLPYLSKFLGVAEDADLARASWEFLKANVTIPRGIAMP